MRCASSRGSTLYVPLAIAAWSAITFSWRTSGELATTAEASAMIRLREDTETLSWGPESCSEGWVLAACFAESAAPAAEPACVREVPSVLSPSIRVSARTP